jgi:hypothetical protein
MKEALDFLLEAAQNPIIIRIIGSLFGAGALWLIDNKVDFPQAKKLALEIAKIAEDEFEEGTSWDNFLDSFISKFEEENGRKPRAGELKTALDVKDKVLKLKQDGFEFDIGGKF